MGTNRPSNRDAPRVPGEEGGGAPWAKIIAALVGLILLAILIPLACQAIRGGGAGEEGSGGGGEQQEEQSRNDGQGGQGSGDDAQGSGGGGGGKAGEEAKGSGGGDGGTQGGGAGQGVSGEISGIEGRGGDGTSVMIPSATINGANGWVAVRADDGGEPGTVLGWAPIREGRNDSVEVALEEPIGSTQRLYAVLHADRPADGEFTFPAEGDPLLDTDERASATEPFRYALTGAAAGEQREGSGIREDQLPESGGASPAVLLATGATLLLAGVALMRGVGRERER